MEFKQNHININSNTIAMMERGYAEETLQNIIFYFNNGNGIDLSVHERSVTMQRVMDSIAEKVPCYQYRNNSLRFNTADWDLHFYCKIHEDGVEIDGKRLDLSYILLSFNDKHDVNKRVTVYRAVMEALKPYRDMAGVRVVLRYSVEYDHSRIKQDALAAVPKLLKQKVTYAGMTGKLIQVEDDKYGFMKSRCRRRYYPLTNNDLLRMAWAMEG